MWCYFFLALLQAIIVLAQQSYGTLPDIPAEHAFEFHGCASVDLNGFGDPIVFLDGVLNPERCQKACHGQRIAALFAHSCRCGNDLRSFSPLPSDACDNPCMGDPELGICGSVCPKKGPEISTIYMAKDAIAFDPELSESSSSPISVSHSVSAPSSTESSISITTIFSIYSHNVPTSSSKSNLISSTPSPVAIPWPSAILIADPPSSTTEGNLDKPTPDTPSQIPGRSFRPVGSNTTVLKSDEREGDPPIPAIFPKSQAHPLQQQLLLVLSGLAFLFATVA